MCYVISVNVTENVPSSILKNAKKRGYHIHLGAPQQKVSTHHSAMQKKKGKMVLYILLRKILLTLFSGQKSVEVVCLKRRFALKKASSG